MSISGRFFPSQKSEEQVFMLLRRHWFTYMIFIFVSFIMSVPVIFIIIYWILNPTLFADIWGNVTIIAVSIWSLIILGLMLYGFVDYYLDVYIVTDERLVDISQDGFFKRAISELNLHQVQDVSAKVTGFFPTMMHYGDIYIQTAGERENFLFRSIPNPYRVSKKIIDLHEAVLERGEGAPERQIDLDEPKDIDPKVLIEARKRTKDFISGRDELEDGVGTEYNEFNASNKNKEIITKIDNDLDKRKSESAEGQDEKEGVLEEDEEIKL